jgi:hypothetical protein
MSYKAHAMREFKAAGWLNEDGSFEDKAQECICNQILELLELFSSHGHSGSTAPYAAQIFHDLALFKTIVPLNGTPDEWNEVGDGIFQNNRCSHVFKEEGRFGGQAYDINAIIFWEWHVNTETGERHPVYFTCGESHQPITFPYTPTSIHKERK